MFFGPDAAEWKRLKPDVPAGTDPAEEQKILAAAKAAKEELKNFLLSSLQMQHVVVLAGSGTSLGPITKGPSMWTLWDYCVNANPGTGASTRTVSPAAAKVIAEIGYDTAAEKENIEALLSRCEAYLQVSLLQKARFAGDFSRREAKAEGAGGHFWHDEALTQTS